MKRPAWSPARAALVACAALALCVGVAVWLAPERRAPPPTDEELEQMYVSCRVKLHKLVEVLRLQIDEQGGMPHVDSLPEIVDPFCNEWPLRKWGVLACPFNARRTNDGLVDSGLRTFNWASDVWRTVHDEVCRGKPAVPPYPPGEVPKGREVPPGLVLAWTSGPVRKGKRYVQILPSYGGGFTRGSSMSLGFTYLLDEREFAEKMEEAKGALRLVKASR